MNICSLSAFIMCAVLKQDVTTLSITVLLLMSDSATIVIHTCIYGCKNILGISGVPILHLIPLPFPSVWHMFRDNAASIHYPTVYRLNRIMRVFVAGYLNLII